MSRVKGFEDLEIYQLAEKLASEIYDLTAGFPSEEKFGLISQIRRAVLSVGANIAESFGRYHYRDKVNLLYYARGSLFEVRHFLRFSYKRNLMTEQRFKNFTGHIETLCVKLNNYIATTRKQIKR